VFRNVDTYNLHAGGSPKRKNTTFKTRQKFEIKNQSRIVFFLITPPMKMEQCSETSAHKIQTPGNYPKKKKEYNIQNTEKV